ncbi:hypothetical protein QE152_g29210 [Popillia japonica]|uniref:Uncharacterized protein n=1 Tax=Popillia japonica TaxID=7064 RepID=A0AAW1JHZ0_POPJA
MNATRKSVDEVDRILPISDDGEEDCSGSESEYAPSLSEEMMQESFSEDMANVANSKMRISSSHPQLSYTNGGNNTSTSSTGHRDQSTQTPDNIAKETRNFKLRSLKLQLNNVPTNLNLPITLPKKRETSNFDL